MSLQGYTGPATFRKLGYNTEVLGFERVQNTTKRIRREAKSLKGLREGARAACAYFIYWTNPASTLLRALLMWMIRSSWARASSFWRIASKSCT